MKKWLFISVILIVLLALIILIISIIIVMSRIRASHLTSSDTLSLCEPLKGTSIFSSCNKCVANCENISARNLSFSIGIDLTNIHSCINNCLKKLDISSHCNDLWLSSSKDRCFFLGGGIEESKEVCLEISNNILRAQCLSGVAKDTKNRAICEMIKSPIQEVNCFIDGFKELPSVKICNKTTDSEEKDPCYETMAIQTRNVSLCSKIVTPFYKGECFGVFASILNDTSLCKNIDDDTEMKQRCLNYRKWYFPITPPLNLTRINVTN